MRPLVLISGLAPGGAERVTVTFLRHVYARGHEVPLCTVTGRLDGRLAEEVHASGIDRYDLGAGRLADPFALGRLVGLLRRLDVDLVHAHGQDAAVLARWARRIHGFKLAITRHVVEEPIGDVRSRWRARASLSALKAADAVVSVSANVAGRMAALGVPRDRIEVIPNGIELASFHPDANVRSGCVVRRQLGVDPDAPVVLMPAVLRPGKGHDTLFDAMPRVRERIPGVTFLLAGDGELGDALRTRAETLGGAVQMLGQREDMPALVAAADVVCLPSLSEAFPTVLLEAAAGGRPVVATRVGGIPEIVDHGDTGHLVPVDDPEALAAALVALLSDHGLRVRLGEAALAKAGRSFGMSAQVERTLALWRRTVGEAA